MKNLDLRNPVFKIKKAVYEEMILHCQETLPYEACGLLSGIQSNGTKLWKIKNESLNSNRFSMSKESIELTSKNANKIGEKISGIFHSHPSSPAYPSSHDIGNTPYPDLAYLIVSFYKGNVEVGCFQINDGLVIPIKLIVVDE
ncbi:Mov34/MPN/PAD-1 family protein [Cytobacillus massiliigabonensis]|uniref:Mov34/MPN/PAD-1 family protein n=1 Tax=Cytobacillus massiliigabonensis TaxID=1871011 RepID=UPI0015E119C2|nr:M67 family metallopeptidase [Cytobacillus massiliigabonensis]